jgi:15-cis-phytoene synthase
MIEELRKIVREADRDRYLSALFAPDDKQLDLFALYAFDAEIARIPKLVSEPQIGEIRLQWWLDTLEAIEKGHDPDHPVAVAFAAVIRKHALPIEHLENLVEARRNDLYADQFPSVFAVESYIAETDAAVMQFAAIILDRTAAAGAATLTGSAGTAFGLARLFARVETGSRFIPQGETLETMRALAAKRLGEAKNEYIPGTLLPAILPAALTELYLSGKTSALRRQWALWRAAKKKKLSWT